MGRSLQSAALSSSSTPSTPAESPDVARSCLEQADAISEVMDSAQLRQVVSLQRGILELALADEARVAGDSGLATDFVESARQRAHSARATAPGVLWAPADHSID